LKINIVKVEALKVTGYFCDPEAGPCHES